MSGRKYTQAELANNLHEAIRCRLAAERACERAESLVAALALAADTTDALRPSSEQARSALARARAEIVTLADWLVEDRLPAISLEEVRARRRSIDALQLDLDRIVIQCREGGQAAALRTEIVQVACELSHSKDTIEPWTRDTYANFVAATTRLVDEADSEIRKTGNATAIADRIQSQVASFEMMLRQAEGRRELDAERRYVAEALRKVCTEEMGFAVRTLPQDGPLDDLVLEVDTFAFGVIHFRLQLDGVIRSLSQMVVASCPTNFSKIEGELRELGVITSFRYEGDQTPVTLGGSAQQLPNETQVVENKGNQP